MKRVTAVLLIVVLCFSCTACSMGKSVKLDADEIEETMEGFVGTLDISQFCGFVSGFTYTIDDVDIELLLDREEYLDAVDVLLENKYTYILTESEKHAVRVFGAFLAILALVSEGGSTNGIISGFFDILYDSEIKEFGGWKVSADVDTINNRVIIMVK